MLGGPPRSGATPHAVAGSCTLAPFLDRHLHEPTLWVNLPLGPTFSAQLTLRPRKLSMTAYLLGNLAAALVTLGLLVGTLRYTRSLG